MTRKGDRGLWHNLVCSCDCGTSFELPDHRVRNNKTGLFFVDIHHKNAGMVGEKHQNFRGGLADYGPDWTRIAAVIRERDKVCQKCGKTPKQNGRALDVHHKVPVRVRPDNGFENLIALCVTCHHKAGISEQRAFPEAFSREKLCTVCGAPFTPRNPLAGTCSEPCKRERGLRYHRAYLKRKNKIRDEAYQRRRQRTAEYQKAHKDKINANHRAAYCAHREERRAYFREWYARKKMRESLASPPSDPASTA